MISQNLLIVRLIVDTRWANGAKRLSFTCGARETQALNSLGFLYEEIIVLDIQCMCLEIFNARFHTSPYTSEFNSTFIYF